MFDTLDPNIIQRIFSFIESPVKLLQLACVNKQFYTLSRANNVWLAHEQRMITQFPSLIPLFKQYRDNKLSNGNRVKLVKRAKTLNNWRTPKGIWYVFARHLLFNSISQVLLRKTSREYIVDAICIAAVDPTHMIDIVRRSHVKLLEQCRFQRCVCLRNFTFMWIGMAKGNSSVYVYSERHSLTTHKSRLLIHNFQHIVRNLNYKKEYLL